MKHTLAVVAAAVVLAGCSTGMSSSAPPVALKLTEVNTSSNVFYFSGPVDLQYQLAITNPTPEPMTLTRLDLRTTGPGAYFLRTAATPMNLTIAPNTTSTYTLSVWGHARGGFIASTEPVLIRGIAYIKSPSGSFTKLFTENVVPGP